MRVSALTFAVTLGTLVAAPPAPALGSSIASGSTNIIAGSVFQIAQVSRAEDTCVNAAEDRGLRVEDILETNEQPGGAEVIMRVSRRSERYSIGCDYNSSNRATELYRIENDGDGDFRDDRSRDSFDDDFPFGSGNDRRDRFSSSGEVRDRQDAENIARDAVRDRLGIDNSDSEVVDIQNIQRENRTWVVEGEANGAPFVVRIRASDASIQDFDLF